MAAVSAIHDMAPSIICDLPIHLALLTGLSEQAPASRYFQHFAGWFEIDLAILASFK